MDCRKRDKSRAKFFLCISQMGVAWKILGGALWVAGASTRLGFSTLLFSASAAVTVVRVLNTVGQAVEVILVVESLVRGQ